MFSRTKRHFDRISEEVGRGQKILNFIKRYLLAIDVLLNISFISFYVFAFSLGIGNRWINLLLALITLGNCLVRLFAEGIEDGKRKKAFKRLSKRILFRTRLSVSLLNLIFNIILCILHPKLLLALWVIINGFVLTLEIVFEIIRSYLENRVKRIIDDVKADFGELKDFTKNLLHIGKKE